MTTPRTARLERLERAGIPPLHGREYRAISPSKPRGPEAARTQWEKDVPPVKTRAEGDDDAEDGPAIFGTGTVYDQWYTVGRFFPFREKFARGAFAKTLADGADVRSMFNHDIGRLLGRRSAGTLDVFETDEALNYEARINADDPLAISAHAQVKRGDVDGSSIWFSVVREEWTFADEDNGLEMDEVVVLEAKLYELGPVVFPANEAAESHARSLDTLLRGLGVDNDDDRAAAVLDALADPDRALEALRSALGLRELPDLRAVCTAAGHADNAQGNREAARAAEEAPEEDPADGTPTRSHLPVQMRAHALAARFGLPTTEERDREQGAVAARDGCACERVGAVPGADG